MEPEGSLPHSQVPATCPYPEHLNPVHNPTSHFLKIHLNIILHLHLCPLSGLFPSGFPTKTLYTPLFSPTRATCPALLILLDFITRTILGEEYTYPQFPWNEKNFNSSHNVSFSYFSLILFSSSRYIFNAFLTILSTVEVYTAPPIDPSVCVCVCVWKEQLKKWKAAVRVEKGVPVPVRAPLISTCTGTILHQGQSVI